jgi:hypothetical protein
VNAENFAHWLRNQGYHVVRTPSSYWYEASRGVYQAFPYQWIIEPPESELRGLLRRERAIALRYSAPVSAPHGMISYHVVCEGPSYDIDTLSRQSRQNVRKGLKHVNVEQISLDRLATDGWRLRQETLARQGREGAESEAWWCRLCRTAVGLDGFEAWGAVCDGDLLASFLAFHCGDCYSLLYEQSATSALDYRVNNALYYGVIHEALQQPGISEVFLGLHSLDAPSSVDNFKFRMGCTARAVRQRVAFHPWLAPVLNHLSHAALRKLVHWRSQNPTLPKIEGMVRFHLEGKRGLREQAWPECLTERREQILQVA